jgi:hypothetical protein
MGRTLARALAPDAASRPGRPDFAPGRVLGDTAV